MSNALDAVAPWWRDGFVMAAKRTSRPKKGPGQRATAATVRDVPVTQAMLFGVRDELIERMDSKFAAMDSKFAAMDSKFAAMDSKFAAMDSKFAAMDSKFAAMDGKFAGLDSKFAAIDARFASLESTIHGLAANVARIGVLVEDQNARNGVVMEALQSMIERQDRMETRLDRVEENVQSLASSIRR